MCNGNGGAVIESTATTVVEPGWQAQLNSRGGLVMSRVVPLPRHVAVGTSVSPVMLEIFNKCVLIVWVDCLGRLSV